MIEVNLEHYSIKSFKFHKSIFYIFFLNVIDLISVVRTVCLKVVCQDECFSVLREGLL